MKKLLVIVVFLSFFSVGLVQAQDNVGLLPTNPFYFLKEWRRSVQNFFTFNVIKKAKLTLQISDEKLAEVKRVAEMKLQESALAEALKNYQKNTERLKTQLESLKENSQNPNQDKLIDQLVNRSIVHLEFFSGLEHEFVESVQKSILKTLAVAPVRLETVQDFRARLKNVLETRKGVVSILQAAGILLGLEDVLPAESTTELNKLKEDLLLKLQGQIQADFEILKDLPVNSLDSIELLDELRAGVEDGTELRNKLNLIRQTILEWAQENKKIRKPEAEKIIAKASQLVAVLEIELDNSASKPVRSGNKSSLVLLDRAKFNLEQAGVSLENRQYGAAFGQASAAATAARNALNRLSRMEDDGKDFDTDIKQLKSDYDDLMALVKEKELDSETDPELFELLNQIEKNLARTADLFSIQAKFGVIDSLLREAKVLLARVEYLLVK